ncbi:MAG: FAD-binding oxidoreductase [Actinomycetota bacterium]|nr:FAD-binding oxidoreductase [Actinomycetota bacterium]
MSLYEALCQIVGKDNVSRNVLDLLCYSHDLAPLPKELLKGFGMLNPEVVVRPRSTSEVSKVVEYANGKNLPITPWGAATWSLGGVLPIEGGIVLDLSGLDEIYEFSPGDEYVRVGAGLVWKRLMDFLEARGFEVGVHPTSAPSATIGGFIATGGGSGVGVTRYGPLGDQLLSLKVVLADGRIIDTDPWDSWFFVGSEGTLGVICEVVLKIYPRGEMKHLMYGFDALDQGLDFLQFLNGIRPYFYSFLDKEFIRFLNQKGKDLLEKEITVTVTLSGTPEEIAMYEKKIDEACQGEKYLEPLAVEEWEERFKVVLSLKSLGPTLFSQEIRIPIRFLGDILVELKELLKNERYLIEGVGGDFGSINLLPVIMTDERKESEFFRTFSLASHIAEIGYKYHGSIYGIGLYNTSYLPRIHGRSLNVMRDIKHAFDPKRILNPSKTTQMRIPAFLFNAVPKVMGSAPRLVSAFLKVVNLLPKSLIRTGLRLMGGKLR